MSLTTQQRRGLSGALAILGLATLASLAWHQIIGALARCFWVF